MTLPSWDSLPIRTKRSRKRLYGVIANEYSLTAWKSLPLNVKRSKKHLYNYIASAKNLEEYDELVKNNMRSTRNLYTYIKENASGSKPTLTVKVKSGESNVSGATVTIGTTEKTTDASGETTFTLDYDDYLVEVSKSGYVDYEENIKFRANHKSFTFSIEAEPVPPTPPVGDTGTVTVTCQYDYDGTISNYFDELQVALSTHDTFDWEDIESEEQYMVGFAFDVPVEDGTLTLMSGEQSTDIPFGSYYLYALGKEYEYGTLEYSGTLTVDGDEEVTITLLPEDEGGDD